MLDQVNVAMLCQKAPQVDFKDSFLVLAGFLKNSLRAPSFPIESTSCARLTVEENAGVGGTEKIDILRFLGAGSFGTVFQIQQDKFLKLPNHASLWKSL